AVHTQLYESMLQLGMRDLDNSAVLAVYETLTGEPFRETPVSIDPVGISR
ncbi:MAG TPA: hypothetical protein G4O08_02790, partial [Anaerolineae bacterium]|nr:hypothetical protein [Anaerolineae bacterium]